MDARREGGGGDGESDGNPHTNHLYDTWQWWDYYRTIDKELRTVL
jgi:hypothetical protein